MRRNFVWLINGSLLMHFVDSVTMHASFGPAWPSLICGVGFSILAWTYPRYGAYD